MATRSSHNWNSHKLPGSFDSVNCQNFVFPSTNPYGIPTVLSEPVEVPEYLCPFRTRVRNLDTAIRGAVHFFLDDYQIEAAWTRPVKSLAAIDGFGAVLTPDFSLYRDWPVAVQLWNVYRSRWLGAWWQSQGLTVIPSVSWSSEASYDFCFLGIEPGSTVAISTQGLNEPTARQLFERGYGELLRRIEPARILCYGPAPETQDSATPVISYPTFWSSRRGKLKEQAGGRSG